MKLTIHPASNGATLIVDLQEADCSPISQVYEFEDGDGSIDGLVGLLYAVAEQLGAVGSKRDRARIRINVEHGWDYLCTEPKCDICGKKEP